MYYVLAVIFGLFAGVLLSELYGGNVKGFITAELNSVHLKLNSIHDALKAVAEAVKK